MDGKAQPRFYALKEGSLTFGAGSDRLAYLAWNGGWRLVVDGSATDASVGDFLPGAAPVFDSPDQVGALGRALPDGELIRLVSTSKSVSTPSAVD